MNDSFKIKFLTGSTVALILLNIVLVYIVWHGPYVAKPSSIGPTKGEIIIRELKLDSAQRTAFEDLKHEHQHIMARVNIRDRHTHEALFNLIRQGQDTTAVSDSLINEIADNRRQIEIATFRHLAAVRKICTPGQQKIFDDIIIGLFKHQPNSPPPGGRDGGPPPDGRPDGPPPGGPQ